MKKEMIPNEFWAELFEQTFLVVVLTLGLIAALYGGYKLLKAYLAEKKAGHEQLVALTKECTMALVNNTNAITNNTLAFKALEKAIDDGFENISESIKELDNKLNKVITQTAK